MNKDCYSPLKIFHHRDRIDAIRAGNRPKPIHAQLILTNRCNQNCEFCAYRSTGYSSNETFNSHHEITTSKALEIVTSLAECGVKAVELTGGGEPTIHPGFVDVCELLCAFGIEYGVVSNGSRWSDRCLEALSNAAWVRVSIDAGNSQTYAVTRRSSEDTYSTVRDDLKRLAFEGGPIIGVGFVVTRHNWREVFEAAVRAKHDGVHNFRISAVFQNDGPDYFSDFYYEASELCKQAQALETDEFTVFNLFGERLEDLEQRSPSVAYCPVQHLVPYIGADLNVYRCCVLAYSGRGLLGSIADCTFEELWNSKEVTDKLDKFNARQCPRCMFNRKNDTIRYAINSNPDHVNFL
jgi:MoaA/NifB/PqqE/SkfB family radical SAM enzyme